MTITIPPRRDNPPETGLYIITPRGTRTPIVATWSERDGHWRHQGRRIEVSGWEGPVELRRDVL